MAKLYHQCGHNSVWNIDSVKENIGGGLIISPVNQKMADVEKLPESIKKVSLFDPQFYLPNSQKPNLSGYPFFPEAITGSSGFSTVEFSNVAESAAELCLKFQIENNFEQIIVPARFFSQMISGWVQKQEVFLRPFLNQVEKSKTKKKVLAALPLTQHMVQDKVFRERVLNWITSFPRIDGVYLIVSIVEDSKQLADGDLLFEMMSFIRTIHSANLEGVVGYCNAESIPLSLGGPFSFTMGSFENTRRFSEGRFVESEEDKRGPKARIYIPKLFCWIQFNHAKEIREAAPKLWDQIYTPSSPAESAFKQAKEPTFNQSPLYKHYFQVFSRQFNDYANLDVTSRYSKLREDLRTANDFFAKIENASVDLDRHARGTHVDAWLKAINRFNREVLSQ